MARVSIGLPVYNGERFLSAAVESLLSQTLTDFELVIVDNASTDRTEEMCKAFAARDARVRYRRNERNVGLAGNWNLAYELSGDAPYFKWAAHDDVHAPAFLERCVAALDADQEAVLAFSRADYIDCEGRTMPAGRPRLPLDAPEPAVRFDALLPADRLCIFGVVRRAALATLGTPVLGSFVDHDGVLLSRLVFTGRFLEVPEVLFFNRHHPQKAETLFGGQGAAWAAWLDPANAGQHVFPQWRRQGELWRALTSAPLPWRDRWQCGRVLARWLVWTRHRLYREAGGFFGETLRPWRQAGSEVPASTSEPSSRRD